MKPEQERIRAAILKALDDIQAPCGASRLVAHLSSRGVLLRPRTIRLHLLQLDRDGLTTLASRRTGRTLSAKGREELARSNVVEKIGFVASKIETLGYRMSYRLREGRGTIITNLAYLPKNTLARAIEDMKQVFARQLGFGNRLAIAGPGQTLAGRLVPPDRVCIATVCSVMANGILLKEGIPVTARFGGLLELREDRPVRFTELIEYRGTTIDPLEFFILAGMTSVRACARTGTGFIGASFRDFPSAALPDVLRIRKDMDRQGISGILMVGQPNLPLLDIPVPQGRTGMVVIGGLNPIAAIREAGIPVELHSLAALADYAAFEPFDILRNRWPG